MQCMTTPESGVGKRRAALLAARLSIVTSVTRFKCAEFIAGNHVTLLAVNEGCMPVGNFRGLFAIAVAAKTLLATIDLRHFMRNDRRLARRGLIRDQSGVFSWLRSGWFISILIFQISK